MKKFFVILLAVVAVMFVVGVNKTSAGDQDFTLVNNTGVDINNLYISPSNQDEWGDDVLGQDQLADGQSANIKFAHDAEDCVWDFMVKDEKGTGVQWTDIDLCKYSTITLHIEGDKVFATFE